MFACAQVLLILPIFFVVIIAFLVVFPLFENAVECLVGLAIIATGIPVYWVMVAWKNKPVAFQRTVSEYNEVIIEFDSDDFNIC